MGDRLMLSGGFHRDGVLFDVGQATSLKFILIYFMAFHSKSQYSEALSACQAVAQSCKSRGLFHWLFC